MSELGQELFVSDIDQGLNRYVRSVAKTYAINAPISPREALLAQQVGAFRNVSTEPIAVQIMNEGLDPKISGGKFIRRQVRGTNIVREQMIQGTENAPTIASLKALMTNLTGSTTAEEQWWGNLFGKVRHVMSGGRMSRRQQIEVEASMSALEKNASYRRKANFISSFFYANTLGMNPFSAMQNALQPILTTAPSIGIGPTLAGYRELGRRLPTYAQRIRDNHRALRGVEQGAPGARTVARLNEAAETAFNETFPELLQQGFKIDPRFFDLDETQILAGGFRSADEYFKFILQPFTQSELSNQVITFFGAKQALRNAMKTGEYSLAPGITREATEQALNFEAGMVVNATQFRPGPGTRTIWQSLLPSPLRQFMSFPVRLANFYGESTVRGAMTQEQLNGASILNILQGGEAGRAGARKLLSLGTGRNLGTVARTFLYGRVAMNGARDVLGVDLGGSLGLTGPFQNVVGDQGQLFNLLPEPPVVGVLTDLASFTSTRDVKTLRPVNIPGIGEIPIPKTLVPGGVGLTRVGRAIQQWRPDMGGFVDENERLMYRGNTTDLILSMLGIPLDKNRRMREAVERVQSNRNAIRDFRRGFALASMTGDFGEQNRLRANYAKQFPDLPPLQMSQKDVLRYRMNARIPVVGRMVRTLGNAGRFIEHDLYAFDPDIIGPPDPNRLPQLAGAF
jgi:hypothetical protein